MTPIPIEWLLGALGVMATALATVASAAWAFMKSRLEAQDKIITKLQDDIDRLSRGCGIGTCLWKNR